MPTRLPPLTPGHLKELDQLYRTAEDGRLRIRALMVLLVADQQLSVPEVAQMLRYDRQTVRRWLRRYLTGGVPRLRDEPKPGAPPKATPEYREALAQALRTPPEELGLPFARWTAQRAAAHLQTQTGIQLSTATVNRLIQEMNREAADP